MDLSNFDNFKQRQMQLGIETMSETKYNGYIIQLRCYEGSGISGKIIKVLESGKKLILMQRAYNYYKPIDFLNELKNFIDKNPKVLIYNLNRKTSKL